MRSELNTLFRPVLYTRPSRITALSLIILVAPAAAFSEQERAAVLARIDSLHAAGNPAIVHAALDSLLPLAHAKGDTSLIIPLLLRLRRGHELATYGKGLQGEPVLCEAAAMAEAHKDSVSLSIALRWLGVAIGGQGRFVEVRDIFSRLRNVAARIDHPSNKAWALVGLGLCRTDGQSDIRCHPGCVLPRSCA